MEIINQKAERLHETGIDLVARAARICYRSEGNKAKNKEFVEGLVKKRHLSPLEFWRLHDERNSILSNARNLIEQGQTINECLNIAVYDYDWIPMEITTNIGIARELMRHRVFSYCQESTRYCNYSKKGLRFIKSHGIKSNTFYQIVENWYETLLEDGLKPEQARGVLPLDTATTFVMGGFKSDWERMLDLRLNEGAGKVHPQMKELAQLIKLELE